MRIWVIGLAALGLAACDSGEVPSPAQQMENPVSADMGEAVDPSLVTLNGSGLTAGPEAFYFAAGQSEVEASLARALGKPGEVMELGECGAGPMESATYADSLTVNFQNGALVGWFLREGAANIVVSDGLGIGTAQADVEAMAGFAMIDGSTLGEEFVLGDELAGFFEEGAVAMLYAGTQCFLR